MNMEFFIEGIRIQIFNSDSERDELPFVIVNCDCNEADTLYEKVKSLTDIDFVLIAVNVPNWNDDLSPWPSDPVFRGTAPFGGKADAYLSLLSDRILPETEVLLLAKGKIPAYLALGGYSLAGLFALHCAYRSDLFSKIISASGSLWYPGFLEFTQKEEISDRVDSVYLSLGDKESHTRNPLMARVEENTGKIAHGLSGTLNVCFEMNEGNHFKDPELRMAKGIAWILKSGSVPSR